jgi:nucleotide-binding universal stress UspA family protein
MRTILVPIDFSDATPTAIDVATDLARALGGKLHLVHVDATDSVDVGYALDAKPGRDELAKVLRAEHSSLLELEASLKGQGFEVRAVLHRGDVVDQILREAERVAPYLIVIGSHGHGALKRLLLGGVSTGVLRRAAGPVVVVPVR